MHEELIPMFIFDEGDLVITPEGQGIVKKVRMPFSSETLSAGEFEVLIQHEEGLSGNPSNKPVWMPMSVPSLLKSIQIKGG